MFGEYLPSLHDNGAEDPDRWRPHRDNLRDDFGCRRPDEGDLIGWRYAAWRVHEIRPYLDVDLTAEQAAKLDRSVAGVAADHRAAAYEQNRPYHIVLRHHHGPVIIKAGEGPGFKRLHNGTREIHFTLWPGRTRSWARLTDPYRTCSCHGHVWPCQEFDQMVVAAHQARKMDRAMATAQPGVCAHCVEPISTRQKTLTFPEESRLVPGAPGPTFHSGRGECWAAAEAYERNGRLVDNPDVTRLASCPGVRFIHEALGVSATDRVECTAGVSCTGRHGPAGFRADPPCWFQMPIAAMGDVQVYPRPGRDCGYRSGERACLGSDLSGGGASISPVAADMLWELRRRR